MATHDRYDNDILKQLTRIANSLDKISNIVGNQKTPRTRLTNEIWDTVFDILQNHASERATMYDTDDIPGWLDEEKEIILNDTNYATCVDLSSYVNGHPNWYDKLCGMINKSNNTVDTTRGTGLWQPGDED